MHLAGVEPTHTTRGGGRVGLPYPHCPLEQHLQAPLARRTGRGEGLRAQQPQAAQPVALGAPGVPGRRRHVPTTQRDAVRHMNMRVGRQDRTVARPSPRRVLQSANWRKCSATASSASSSASRGGRCSQVSPGGNGHPGRCAERGAESGARCGPTASTCRDHLPSTSVRSKPAEPPRRPRVPVHTAVAGFSSSS